MVKHWQRTLAYLPAATWYGFVFWLSSQPKLPGPEDQVLQVIWFKTAHAIFYAILTILLILATFQARGGKRSLRRLELFFIFMAVIFLAVADELHQGFVPGRNPRTRDVLIDSLASAAVLLAFSRYNWARRKFLLPGM